MRFRVLGPIDMETDTGETVTPQALKIRSLLALFCMHAGHVVSPARLVSALWAGTPPRTAATALQVYVSKLRGQFAQAGASPTLITTTSSGYTMRLDGHSLDLTLLERSVAKAQQAIDNERILDATQLLSQSLGLWRGTALADVRTTPALEGYAQQLDERRNALREQRLTLELRLGRHSQLIGELYGLAQEHPMWENVHACLMIALYRSGRIPECLEAYKQIRRTLQDELGMEPCNRLCNLHRAILAREPWLDDHRRPLSSAYAA
ncbi:BTAD domain-containing putative transcriptional regulator [Streptomyces sp. NBC_00859]|uniref:AfsR/SARP family transcriptional regulator n=1 Tax=Streptomyces sp. NBC_00859 TaxID=2903682 RepID=UPI0038643DE5|nr:AfsR/SARP family transcriptional regulator [Streptomyces sp. NBC_00859]